MNLTVYSQFAGNDQLGMVYGTYHLANEWRKSGHKVTIVSASFSHTRHTQPDVGWSLVKTENIMGIKYVWIKTISHRSNNLPIRLLNIAIFTFMASLYAIGRQVVGEARVICSSHHPFAVIPAWLDARKNASTLTYEIRDLWPLSLLQIAELSKYNPIYQLMNFFEGVAISCSDNVVSVLSNVDSYLCRYANAPKSTYIPNGFAPVKSEQSDLPNTIKERIRLDKANENLIIAYTGSLGYANRLDELLQVIALLKDQKVALYIAGSGAREDVFLDKLDRLDISGKVVFVSEINRAGVFDLLSFSDVGYIGYLDLQLYDYGISPTKINDYLYSEVLVLFLADIPLGDIGDCPSVTQCFSIDDLHFKIQSLIQCRDDIKKYALLGREWVEMNRSYEKLAHKFIEVIS